MWTIYEHRRVAKQLRSLPQEILKRYEKWKDIVRISGPKGLRFIKGFHDEALRGDWNGYRSSRLNKQWRVLYKAESQILVVYVIAINAHDYKRRR